MIFRSNCFSIRKRSYLKVREHTPALAIFFFAHHRVPTHYIPIALVQHFGNRQALSNAVVQYMICLGLHIGNLDRLYTGVFVPTAK